MGEQRRITEPFELLDEWGELAAPGYATAPLWRYDRARVHGSRLRIKEWDYYAVLAPAAGVGLTVTVADLGYLGLVRSIQHQVFGHFAGRVVLDGGEELAVDGLLGFAEDVLNWW